LRLKAGERGKGERKIKNTIPKSLTKATLFMSLKDTGKSFAARARLPHKTHASVSYKAK